MYIILLIFVNSFHFSSFLKKSAFPLLLAQSRGDPPTVKQRAKEGSRWSTLFNVLYSGALILIFGPSLHNLADKKYDITGGEKCGWHASLHIWK